MFLDSGHSASLVGGPVVCIYQSKMSSKRDYYEVLEISRTATPREIATSYRKLAVKFHPDKNPGDEEATERFKEAAEAYEVLSDGQKRARYDQYGHAGVEGAGGAPHFPVPWADDGPALVTVTV